MCQLVSSSNGRVWPLNILRSSDLMLKKYCFVIAILFAGCSVFASNADASFTVTWDFDDSSTFAVSQSGTVSPSGSNLTVDPVTRINLSTGAPGLENTLGSFGATGWDSSFSDRYIAFGVTVAAGFNATFENIKFVSEASSAGPKNMSLRWSNDGGSTFTTITNFDSNVPSPGDTFASGDSGVTGFSNLSGEIILGIFNTSTVAAGGGTVSSSGGFALQEIMTLSLDVTADSPTAVPEPTSLLMVAGAGLAGFVGVRRRKRKALAAA